MAKNAASRQNTGLIPNPGAVLIINLAYLLCLDNAAQPDALKDFPNGAFPHHPQRPWSHGVFVGLLLFPFLV